MDHLLAAEDGVAPANNVVAVAIDRDKNSQFAARWAINNLLIKNKDPSLILIHVRKEHKTSDMDGTAPDGHGESIDAGTQWLFKAFHTYCGRKGIQARSVVLDGSDVSKALLDYINENNITNIVLGASTRSDLQKSHDVATIIMESAPGFCSVYVIANNNVKSVRPALLPEANLSNLQSTNQKVPSQFSTEHSKPEEEVRAEQRSIQSESSRNNRPANLLTDTMDLSFRGQKNSSSRHSHGSGSTTSSDSALEETHSLSSVNKDIEAELRRLKLELKQTIGMYNTACKEAVTAKKKVKEIHQWKIEEAHMFEQARLAEEAALALAKMEKAKCRAATEAAEKAQKLARMEAERRKYAELKVKREAEAKTRALTVLSNNDVRYRKYTMEEIEAATDHFSNSLKIGEGGYGPVFKGKLDHTRVAIKVLGSGAAQGKKQFQQEIEVLCSMRHPNMVLLLGACPQYGCLIYEYMDYGSLEDRLFRKGNTPSIPWGIRFKIAAEIATGLLFLHNAKPEPLVHRDLKPANILLDHNYECKISDVGLSRLVPAAAGDNVTQFRMTSAAGTFCYIDPEYQQTGKLVVKSDIYSFGVMLLQILTARPPMGLTHHVERSIAEGTFADVLDPTVPDWPVEEALAFAKLALQCAELKRKGRPDLATVVLPELSRLRELGRNKPSHSLLQLSPVLSPLESSENAGKDSRKTNNTSPEEGSMP